MDAVWATLTVTLMACTDATYCADWACAVWDANWACTDCQLDPDTPCADCTELVE